MLNCEALRAWIGSWLNPNGKCRFTNKLDSLEGNSTQAMPSTIAERSKFYFPELDGLRFIAFLLVFIHHAPVPDFRVWRFLHSF